MQACSRHALGHPECRTPIGRLELHRSQIAQPFNELRFPARRRRPPFYKGIDLSINLSYT